MTQPKIAVRSLYKIFGAREKDMVGLVKDGVDKPTLLEKHGHVLGLSDINIDMQAGEITVIMGLSGSGKSTLIRHLNRLIEPTAGEILVDGEDVMSLDQTSLRALRQQRMSMVFQKFALLPHQTVQQNTEMPLSVQGATGDKPRQAALKWLARVGLSGYEDRYPAQLSGGMQQRVGIARALAADTDIMLLDEAFSALDPLIRTDMQDLLLELQRELSKTIIFITHDLDEALKIADHLVILKDGAVVQQGNPQHILLEPSDPYIEDFVSDINRARVLRVGSVMSPASRDTFDGDLSTDQSLEDVIRISEGRIDRTYRVVSDGDTVGELDTATLVKALVPRARSSK
ncbi:MAG: betaine/proline/choline family ABC transporter ATP-binding protein [Pseudomonadota bacterium]